MGGMGVGREKLVGGEGGRLFFLSLKCVYCIAWALTVACLPARAGSRAKMGDIRTDAGCVSAAGKSFTRATTGIISFQAPEDT